MHALVDLERRHAKFRKNAFRTLPASPSGDRACVTERRDAGCVRAMRVSPATANPSREWGSPEGANRRLAPFGATLLVLFCSRQKSTLLHRRWPLRRAPAKGKELFFKKRFPPTFRREHFSTVGGLHGVRLPRLKNLFFQACPARPHPYKLPSARTHWSTLKNVTLILEQPLSEPFRRVRAGTGRASPKGVMPDACVQ